MFFNINNNICKGHTYIDINKKICYIAPTPCRPDASNCRHTPAPITPTPAPVTHHPIKLNWITSYSSFADDPALGLLASADPDNIGDGIKGPNQEHRIYNLKQVRKNRTHHAAGGVGTYNNPITAATSTTGGQLNDFNKEVGNIYWIPYFKKYIIIEDINATDQKPSSLDIWVGINDMDHNNISYYDTNNGNSITIKHGNTTFSYNSNDDGTIYSSTMKKTYTKWDTKFSDEGYNQLTFVKDVQQTFNNSLINRYIYCNLSAMGNNSLIKDDNNSYYYTNINTWLAPSGGFNVVPDPYPIINFGYPLWNSSGSPSLKPNNNTIINAIKNLNNSNLYQNFGLTPNAGLFCESPPCLATGDNMSNPYLSASADVYYLPT